MKAIALLQLLHRSLLMVILVGPMIFDAKIWAAEYTIGISAIEEGDDRLRPAARLQLEAVDWLSLKLEAFGRDHGPFQERYYLISAAYPFRVFENLPIKHAVGLVGSQKIMSFQGITDSSTASREEQGRNFGIYLGVCWQLFWQHMLFQIAWDSHIFPAGINSILLATGRIQSLSVSMGLRL